MLAKKKKRESTKVFIVKVVLRIKEGKVCHAAIEKTISVTAPRSAKSIACNQFWCEVQKVLSNGDYGVGDLSERRAPKSRLLVFCFRASCKHISGPEFVLTENRRVNMDDLPKLTAQLDSLEVMQKKV